MPFNYPLQRFVRSNSLLDSLKKLHQSRNEGTTTSNRTAFKKSEYEVVTIALCDIEGTNNYRDQDDLHVEKLAHDMLNNGINASEMHESICVVKKDDQYLVQVGHHRVQALQLLSNDTLEQYFDLDTIKNSPLLRVQCLNDSVSQQTISAVSMASNSLIGKRNSAFTLTKTMLRRPDVYNRNLFVGSQYGEFLKRQKEFNDSSELQLAFRMVRMAYELDLNVFWHDLVPIVDAYTVKSPTMKFQKSLEAHIKEMKRSERDFAMISWLIGSVLHCLLPDQCPFVPTTQKIFKMTSHLMLLEPHEMEKKLVTCMENLEAFNSLLVDKEDEKKKTAATQPQSTKKPNPSSNANTSSSVTKKKTPATQPQSTKKRNGNTSSNVTKKKTSATQPELTTKRKRQPPSTSYSKPIDLTDLSHDDALSIMENANEMEVVVVSGKKRDLIDLCMQVWANSMHK